jgi:hypothetical protein
LYLKKIPVLVFQKELIEVPIVITLEPKETGSYSHEVKFYLYFSKTFLAKMDETFNIIFTSLPSNDRLSTRSKFFRTPGLF